MASGKTFAFDSDPVRGPKVPQKSRRAKKTNHLDHYHFDHNRFDHYRFDHYRFDHYCFDHYRFDHCFNPHYKAKVPPEMGHYG